MIIGRVRGRVQGVWFRRHVAEVARRVLVNGYARNLPDGSVEVLLAGDDGAVSRVRTAVEEGPPGARVDAVEWRPAEGLPAPVGFEVL